jgi:hypothetical protein
MAIADTVASSGGLSGRWNRFCYAEGNPLSLGVFRALFAICLAFELPVTRSMSVFAIRGGFHLPYLSFLPPLSPEIYQLMHALQVPFIALLGLGILPRVCAGVLLGVQGYIFFADQLNFRNHPYLFLLLLLLLMFAPSGKGFSIPALFRGLIQGGRGAPGPSGATAPLTMQRLMQVQISIVYFYAALHKMTGQFLGGHVLADLLGGAVSNGRVGHLLAGWLSPAALEGFRASVVSPEFWVFSAWMTVILELTLPFALWVPRWRMAAMVFGVPFHLAIGYTMKIEIFSAVMISSYLLFLDPATLPSIWQRVRGRWAGPPPSARPAKRRRARA